MVQKKDDNVGVKVAVGVGMLAALSAGAYFLYGTKEGAKKRIKIRGWVLKAKGEVMDKLENLKDVNEDAYNAIVHSVMKKYEGLKTVDKTEVDALVSDLKKHWKSIKKHIDEAKKPTSGSKTKAPKTKKIIKK